MTRTMNERLYMICNGMLYFGAMLAGMSGHGWAMMAVFVLIFFMWLLMQTPGMMPHQISEWLRSDALYRNGARLAIQCALVLFCFALGRGVGGVTGLSAHLPVSLSLGVSFAALPIARLLRPENLA